MVNDANNKGPRKLSLQGSVHVKPTTLPSWSAVGESATFVSRHIPINTRCAIRMLTPKSDDRYGYVRIEDLRCSASRRVCMCGPDTAWFDRHFERAQYQHVQNQGSLVEQ
jgi:hypothetical protein